MDLIDFSVVAELDDFLCSKFGDTSPTDEEVDDQIALFARQRGLPFEALRAYYAVFTLGDFIRDDAPVAPAIHFEVELPDGVDARMVCRTLALA